MRRETTLDTNKYIFEKTSADVTTIVENFKKEFEPKIMNEIEPLLNAVLTSNLKSEDQEKLVSSIHDKINVYYYMNNNILIKLINYAAGPNMISKLKKIKGNPLNINDIIEENLSKNQKVIFQQRFDNLVERYIEFLINVL